MIPTLIAVVVGAAISGGAQYLNARSLDRRARDERTRQDRRDAYLEFGRCVEQERYGNLRRSNLDKAREDAARAGLSAAEHPSVSHERRLREMVDSAVSLMAAQSRIQFVAPYDTASASGEVTVRLQLLAKAEGDVTAGLPPEVAALEEAKKKFNELARRDLGIVDVDQTARSWWRMLRR